MRFGRFQKGEGQYRELGRIVAPEGVPPQPVVHQWEDLTGPSRAVSTVDVRCNATLSTAPVGSARSSTDPGASSVSGFIYV